MPVNPRYPQLLRGRLALLLLSLGLSGCGWNPWGGMTFEALIQNQSGAPLAGAVASYDGRGAIADSSGRVRLEGVRGRVWITKPGYSPMEVDAKTDAVAMAKREGAIRVVWDERFSAPVPMEGLKSHLVNRGFQVSTLSSGQLPAQVDVVVLSCPSWFTEEAYTEYMRAAHAGSKLVLLGEWGGYDGVDLAALSSISKKAGISFESGQVRVYGSDGQPQPWLSFTNITPAALGEGVTRGVSLFTAGVLSLEAPAQSVLTSESKTVRILRWDVGAHPVAAIGPLGRSQVVAIADSSLFSDETGPNGQPQWSSADNARFAENVMSW